jgi:hypothetical protein
MTAPQRGRSLVGSYSWGGGPIRFINDAPRKSHFPDDPNNPLAGFVTTAM